MNSSFLLQAEMDARIARFQQLLQERDGEVNRLQTEQRVRDKITMKNSSFIIMIIFFMTVQVQTASGDKSNYIPAMQHPPQKSQVNL